MYVISFLPEIISNIYLDTCWCCASLTTTTLTANGVTSSV